LPTLAYTCLHLPRQKQSTFASIPSTSVIRHVVHSAVELEHRTPK
jgi:hypothetical protein